jgi:hypothetical protein
MPWSQPMPASHPKEIHVPRVDFLGEQDGAVERELKTRLSAFFKRDRSVYTAYLARVGVVGQASVALCLKSQFGPDRGLAEKVGSIFRTIFNAQTHLDIIFLSEAQETELAKVCRPFFLAQSGGDINA